MLVTLVRWAIIFSLNGFKTLTVNKFVITERKSMQKKTVRKHLYEYTGEYTGLTYFLLSPISVH